MAIDFHEKAFQRSQEAAPPHDAVRIMERLIQIGKVIAVSIENHAVRVKHEDTGIISGWLKVLDNRPYFPDYDRPWDGDVLIDETELRGGGSGDPAYEEHTHDARVRMWMPKIDDMVLCVYLPVRNGDGFVLGKIWQ